MMDRHTTLREQYDRWHDDAEAADDDPRQRKHDDWILGLLSPRPGSLLLDVACGRGSFLRYAADRGLEVAGIDISPVAIEAARRRLGADVDLRVGSGENLPFDDDSFDYVTCLGSLEHYIDPEQGAREIARVL